jgi:4-hydroxy-tetrahydrodipicolinate synthase
MKQAQILTPVITAFDREGNLDEQGNKAVWDHLVENGIDGIAVMGSTGEFFSMSMEQKRDLTRMACEHIKGKTKALIGTSCMQVDETIELSNYALDLGADAVMIIHPYYFALSDESVEVFYDAVASNINGNIILYNFPDRTGKDLTPEVVINLLRKHKNIVGYKDTVTTFKHTRELLDLTRDAFPEFQIYSGFDEFLAHNILAGGNGCVGGLSNIYPGVFTQWTKAINEKDMEKVSEYQQKIDFLMAMYDIGTPFIPIVKKAMILKGLPIQDVSTQPFLPATEEQTEKIKTILKAFDAMI